MHQARVYKLKYMMCLAKLKATLALAAAKANRAVFRTSVVQHITMQVNIF